MEAYARILWGICFNVVARCTLDYRKGLVWCPLFTSAHKITLLELVRWEVKGAQSAFCIEHQEEIKQCQQEQQKAAIC